MSRRTLETFSASPRNPDAVLVLAELKKITNGKRSDALWAWAAGYLRGQARQTPTDSSLLDDDLLDAIDSALDNL